MKNKGKEYTAQLVLTSVMILLPMVIGLLMWNRLPDRLATHFGADGRANGWSSRPMAVFGLPLFLLAMQWLVFVMTRLDPKRRNISAKMFTLVLWVIPAVSLLCCGTTYAYALDESVRIDRIVNIFLGIVFVVIGNYLPKCRQSYTMGIRLPWTLASEDNWHCTHRFAGVVWVLGGIAIFAAAVLFDPMPDALPLAVIAILVLLPTGYSLLYYLRHGKEEKDSSEE